MRDLLKEKIHTAIKNAFGQDIELDHITVDYPKDLKHGDYTSNIAFQLASKLHASPFNIAKKIVDNFDLGSDNSIKEVNVAKPGFINFTLNTSVYIEILQEIVNNEFFGHSDIGQGKKIIVEYSSPNIAKPFTIGHFRSTIIGDAIANILEFVGYTVYRDNHLGDWGTQFGKLIYAIKTWGNEKELDNSSNPVKKLVDLYVKFHKEAEKDSSIEAKGRGWFKKLEQGNEEARRIWKKCIDWSWKEFDKIYNLLGVRFTENDGKGYGESFFEDKMKPVIDELKKKKLLKRSKGAWIVEFSKEDKLPPLLILKSDGATLYATRDLATDKFRLEKYGKDIIIINEVGSEQKLYFQQLFKIEQKLGWFKPYQRVHKMHGLYKLKEGKMSTRKGRVIWLEDVLNEAINRVKKIMQSSDKNYSSEELEKISKIVGIGALKWNDLKRQSHLDITFDWDEILQLEGNSAPYIQYTYARARSILRKQENFDENFNIDLPLDKLELELLKTLIKFPDVVEIASKEYAPNYIATFLFELAQIFNRFYKDYPVLKEKNEDKRHFRLLVTKAVSIVIKNGLNLLGIEVVEKM